MEYRIIAKPITLGNPISNAILERIHHALGNLVRTCNIIETYVDKDGPWLDILAAAAFEICSTANRLKCYIVRYNYYFGPDMILPIKT